MGIAGLLGLGVQNWEFDLWVDNRIAVLSRVNDKEINIFPIESLKNGMPYVWDRKAEGVVGDLTIRENIILAVQVRNGWFKSSTNKTKEIADQ